jgi:hypothetical protein
MHGVGRRVLLIVGLALWPSVAGADESSVTLRVRHARCEPEIWSHVEQSALEQAAARCAERGGIDPESVRFVHDDGALGNDRICILHAHFTCAADAREDLASARVAL